MVDLNISISVIILKVNNSLPKNRRGNTSQLNLWGQCYTDTKTRQRHQHDKKQTNYTLIFFMDIDEKINKILANWIQKHLKMDHTLWLMIASIYKKQSM